MVNPDRCDPSRQNEAAQAAMDDNLDAIARILILTVHMTERHVRMVQAAMMRDAQKYYALANENHGDAELQQRFMQAHDERLAIVQDMIDQTAIRG